MSKSDLAALVPRLPAETLHQLVRQHGLDACGELIAAATPAQINSLLDLELWRSPQPGADQKFDVDRFGEWLEALVDTGDAVAARTVASLDRAVAVAGLSRYIRVFDPGTFEPVAQSDDEKIERHELMNSEGSADVAECEVGGYLVRARRMDAWDAIVALLVALEAEHHDDFHALMRDCRRLSNSTPELDGFHDLPLAPAQHLAELTADREDRRAQRGFATAADARAFLQMARQRRSKASAPNPIAAAYFRAVEEQVAAAKTTSPHAALEAARHDDREHDQLTALSDADIELLAEAGLPLDRPRALLQAGDEPSSRLPLLSRFMEFVLQRDETAYRARGAELAFLANTLLAGCSIQSRPFTPQEASEAAASICNVALECCDDPAGDAYLLERDLIGAFEMGWSILYHDVTLFVVDQLVTLVREVEDVDAETRIELLKMRRALEKHRDAGTPWLARNALEAIATLDMTSWISVRGLLDECPVIPAAMTAILEHRTTPVTPSDFTFIATKAQLGDVHIFARTLHGLFRR